MSKDTTDTTINGASRVLDVNHRLVQRAIQERVQFLIQEVPGLLCEEAEQIVQEGIKFDALEGRLNERLIADPWGKVRHSPVDRRRAVEAVEQRLVMPHLQEVDRIYVQACRDLEAIGLKFDVLESYRHRRIFKQFRCPDSLELSAAVGRVNQSE
jgi:hypothetical protein